VEVFDPASTYIRSSFYRLHTDNRENTSRDYLVNEFIRALTVA
jgi:hypothetical protein